MTAAWFDKRITQSKLDKMDAKYTKRYGKVKTIREKDVSIDDDEKFIVDEGSQIMDDLKREAVDYDETVEDY